nr:uncharacterized protein LOC111986818 [Quercus suber]
MGHNANYAHNMLLNDSDSDDDFEIIALLALEEERLEREGASTSHCGSVLGRRIIQRDHGQGHQRLFQDYFAESPVYPLNVFRRRFRMSRSLFLRIKSSLEEKDEYFVQKRNAAGVLEYLRSPNSSDIARLLRVGESRGFPGMLGSIDCMHWKWKNCPSGWKGQYTGHSREPTIILEAVASYDLWIWHAFFGLPGSLNDINVLDHSFIFTKLAQGLAPSVNYSINGHDYTMGYYLADEDLDYIMKACIILHNMIIEDERDVNGAEDFDYEQVPESIPTTVSHERTEEFSQFAAFIAAH